MILSDDALRCDDVFSPDDVGGLSSGLCNTISPLMLCVLEDRCP